MDGHCPISCTIQWHIKQQFQVVHRNMASVVDDDELGESRTELGDFYKRTENILSVKKGLEIHSFKTIHSKIPLMKPMISFTCLLFVN